MKQVARKARRTVLGLRDDEYRIETAFTVDHMPNIHIPEGSVATGDLVAYEVAEGIYRDRLLDRFASEGTLPVKRYNCGVKFWTPIPGEFVGEDDDVVLRAYSIDKGGI